MTRQQLIHAAFILILGLTIFLHFRYGTRRNAGGPTVLKLFVDADTFAQARGFGSYELPLGGDKPIRRLQGAFRELEGREYSGEQLFDHAQKPVAEILGCVLANGDIDVRLSSQFPVEFTVKGQYRWSEDVASGQRLSKPHAFAPGSYRILVKKSSDATTQRAEPAGR